MFFKRLIRNKKLFALILIVSSLLIVFLGAKIYLYANFLLGNDIVVKLNVDKEYIYFAHGDESIVEFESKVTTNPFCSAICTSKFIDVDNGVILDQSRFSLKPGNPYKQAYKIKAKEKGTGKDFYSYNLECSGSEGFLCHSDFETSNRNLLITAEYDFTGEEKALKKAFEENAMLLADEISLLEADILSLKPPIDDLDKIVITDYNFSYEEDVAVFKNDLASTVFQEGYFFHAGELNDLIERFSEFKNNFVAFEEGTLKNISAYNEMIDTLVLVKASFENLSYSSEEELDKIKNLSEEFNLVVDAFARRNSLEVKKDLVNGIAFKLENISSTGNKINLSEIQLREINFTKIEIIKAEPEKFQVEFFPYEPMCCINGNCARCCIGNECNDDASTFPVVFLHGHSVSKDSPLEYSLEGFKDIQKKLEEEGYLNAGAITLYTKKDVPAGIWNLHLPLSIRGSYYFDLFEEPENYKVVLTKSENIDTYAVRLKEIFDNIKLRTGKNKINVIAFSMGGLVMRRHMQLFGNESFDKVILLGTPNKGIIGEVSAFCPIVGGEKRECSDMESSSLFMQKLNKDKIPENVYNIYGTGCAMSDGLGDGIVLEDNAKLDIQNNFIINGTCRGKFQPLHLDLLKIELYPEVYETIKGILEKKTALAETFAE